MLAAMAALRDLPHAWTTAGPIDGLWGDTGGTYGTTPFDALPPVEDTQDETLAWLASAPKRDEGMVLREQSVEAVEALLAAHTCAAKTLGLRLPPSFTRLLTSPALQTRIPSVTACYFDLGTALLLVPGGDESARMLRFLNDQQSCVFWYLVLLADGSHTVASASPEWGDEDKPAEEPATLDEAYEPVGFEICAGSFTEFVKRFWVENTLWFFLSEGEDVPPGELSRYAEAAQRAVAEGRGPAPVVVDESMDQREDVRGRARHQ
jgi:hypothetical protein